MQELLRRQWTELRAWLDRGDVRRHGSSPSILPGWTVRDLVVHLGVGLVMLDEVPAAPPGTAPLSVGDYVAGYRPAAPVIAAATSSVAATMSDELEGVDRLAARAWTATSRIAPPVVLGRRGPLTWDDFLLTRLIELVVHGDDLHRSVADPGPSPVLAQAASSVAAALAEAYAVRATTSADVSDPDRPLHWIRLATGRLPSSDPLLPLL